MKAKILFALLLLPCLCQAQTGVLLGWEANMNTNCVGYRLLAGTASRTYTITNTVLGRTTITGDTNMTGVVSNVPVGRVFLALVAFDKSGFDSDFSNEVTWTNRLSAPKNLRLTGTIQASLTPTGPWTNLASMNIPFPAMVSTQQFYRTRLLLEELP